MHRFLAAAVLLLGDLACPTAARAVAFQDPSCDLRVDLAVPNAVVCYLRPAELRTAPGACDGLRLADLEANAGGARMFAVVRFPDWAYSVVEGVDPRSGTGVFSRADARAFYADMQKGVTQAHGEYSPAASEPELLVVNDLQVMRYGFTSRDRSSPAAEILVYSVVGRRQLVELTFTCDAAHLEALKALAWQTVSTVAMPAVKASPTWDERAEGPAYEMGRAIGRMVGSLAQLAGICILAVLAYRAIRKKSAKAP